MLVQEFFRACRLVAAATISAVIGVLGRLLDLAGGLLVGVRGTRTETRAVILDGFRVGCPSPNELIHQAYLDMVSAQRLFAEVSEPEMVDQAIYLLNAAETRYSYLLKQARQTASYSLSARHILEMDKEAGKGG